jgi:hypothetical protein
MAWQYSVAGPREVIAAHRDSGKRLIVVSRHRCGEMTDGPIRVRLIRPATYAEYVENFPALFAQLATIDPLAAPNTEQSYADQGYEFFEAEWPE